MTDINIDFARKMAGALAYCWESVYDKCVGDEDGINCETVASAVAHFYESLTPISGRQIEPLEMLVLFTEEFSRLTLARLEHEDCDDGYE